MLLRSPHLYVAAHHLRGRACLATAAAARDDKDAKDSKADAMQHSTIVFAATKHRVEYLEGLCYSIW